jgi:hypothetical protein
MRPISNNWHEINLEEFSTAENRNFVGRISGMEISRRAGLRSLVMSKRKIRVNFPKDTTSVNSVFVEELLEPVFNALDKGQDIDNYFSVKNDSLYNVEAMVSKAVDSLKNKKAAAVYHGY